MNKKAIPLTVTKALLNVEKDLKSIDFKIQRLADDNLLHLQNVYLDQKFFFKISKYSTGSRNEVRYHYSFMPSKAETFEATSTHATVNTLESHLKHWLSYLRQYNTIRTPFADKFQKIYEEQFTEYIKLVDEDANTMPYSIETQKIIYDKLKQIVSYLEAHNPDGENEDFEIIIEESKELQNTLSTSVKKTVYDKFISILAKLWKLGITVFEGALGNAAFEIIKGLL